jgi:hypothetical protein
VSHEGLELLPAPLWERIGGPPPDIEGLIADDMPSVIRGHRREPQVKVLRAPGERPAKLMTVQLDEPGVGDQSRDPGLLAGLALRSGPGIGVTRLEVPAEL